MMFNDMDDLMRAFGGGGDPFGRGGGSRRRKGRDVGHALPVTLEDLYRGKKVELPHEKTVLCSTCQGRGTKKDGVMGKCTSCNGHGAKIVRRQMGPMIQQMQVPCDVCNGEGFKINPKDRCTTCEGQRTKVVSSPLRVVIQRGMEHQQQIPFHGEGDQQPDVDPGDIIVVLQQVKHPRFTRYGNDLLVKQHITLQQALCGFDIVLEHLDERKLLIRSRPGQITKAGDVKCIVGEGMPLLNQPQRFGDLVLEFVIDFPERLQDSQMELLRKVLPPPPRAPQEPPADTETSYLERQSLEELRRMIEQEDDDDDDARGGGGGGVQCAQQ